MNITGNALIFRKEYEGKNIYSTTISNKDVNGNYTNMYITVQLPKGVELENKTYIEITKGFLSFYTDKNGLSKVKVVVMEFQEDYEKEEREAIQTEDTAIDYSEDSLPF